jgi:tight adherence protein C
MELPVILGSAAVMASIGLLWWTFAFGDPKKAQDIGTFTTGRRDLDMVARREAAADDSMFVGTMARLGRHLTPRGRALVLEQRLLAAGSPRGWTAERLLAIKGVVAIGTVVMLVLRFTGGNATLTSVALTIGIGVACFVLPDTRLQNAINTREALVRKSLAETIDQITVMVSSGLSLDGAIARVGRGGEGPLATEFVRVAQDIRAGIPRGQALMAMAERIQLPELRQVVSALAQAEQLGVPLAQTLHIQSADMREKRRQIAEEKAMKLPVKVLFPTVFCILPCLFAVILGPAIMNIMDAF